MENFDQKIAFRKTFRVRHQVLISQNSTKGDPLGRQGVEFLRSEEGVSAPSPAKPPPPPSQIRHCSLTLATELDFDGWLFEKITPVTAADRNF